MRSYYPHLPNPKMFVPREHVKKSYWQEIASWPELKELVLSCALIVAGFLFAASL